MKNKTKVFSIVLFLSVFMILVSCQKQKAEWKGTIKELDGVMVVKNPEEPLYGENTVTLIEEVSIGEGAGAEEYMFASVGGIFVDDEGKIIVSDSKDTVIKIFDVNGRFKRTIGRKGQGPGEFSRIDSFQITSKGELLVVDNVNRRLSYFSLTGDLINSLSIKELPAASNNWEVDTRGNIIMDTVQFTAANQLVVETKIYDSQHEFVKVLRASKPYDLSIPFHPFHYWRATASDHIVYAYNDTYELQVFGPAWKLVRRIQKDFDPVKIREDEIEEELKRKRLPPDTEVPSHYPAFHIFVADDEGRIFVRTWERSEDGNSFYYDVFDSDGRYVTKFPFHATPRIIKKEKLYTVEEDEEGYQMVKRYEVTWKY